MIKKKYTILITFLDVLVSIFVLLIPLFSKYMVDEALNINEGKVESYNNLILYLVIIASLLILAIVINITSYFTYSKFYLDNEERIKNIFHKSLMDKSIQSLIKYRTGDIEVLYEQDVSNVLRKYLSTIPSIITQLIRAVVAFSLLIIVDDTKYKLFAIAVVVLGVFAALLAKLYSRVIKKHHKNVLISDSNASAFMIESYENSLLVKSYNSSNRVIGYYSNLNHISRTVAKNTFCN